MNGDDERTRKIFFQRNDELKILQNRNRIFLNNHRPLKSIRKTLISFFSFYKGFSIYRKFCDRKPGFLFLQ